MAKLENPVLRRELKVRLRIATAIPAIALRCVCLGLIFLLVLLSRLGRGLLAFILAEALLILLFTPGAVCSAFAGNAGRDDLRDLALTRLNSETILLGKLAGANLYICIIILFSALVMFCVALLHRGIHIWRLVCANMALLILVFASAVIGLAFSVLFRRNILASATLAYILILMLIGSIVIPGPLIERMREHRIKAVIIKAALYVNPLIMTSRALGDVDIMRTEYMYTLADPIVGRGFTYPDWRHAGMIYFGISCLLLVPIYIRFNLARRPSIYDNTDPTSYSC
jgi:hypothetical protein